MRDSNRLPILAEVANSHHDVTVVALRTAAESARIAGDALREAKTLVPHGGWSDWIKQNFSGGMRTAQRYMKIAKNWETIVGKNDSVSLLTVTQALDLLEGSDELERALRNQAEIESLRPELDMLRKAVESADGDGLRYIAARAEEIQHRLVDLADIAIRESMRLRNELDSVTTTPPGAA